MGVMSGLPSYDTKTTPGSRQWTLWGWPLGMTINLCGHQISGPRHRRDVSPSLRLLDGVDACRAFSTFARLAAGTKRLQMLAPRRRGGGARETRRAARRRTRAPRGE